MSGAVWVYVVVGLFVLVVGALGVLLIVGRLRGRVARPPAGSPGAVPRPGAQPIPPTGSR